MDYRHELKYIITYADLAVLRMRFAALMRRDKHVNGDGTYTIRSLYFDDYGNSAYNEKYMGVQARQKYRIRIYNGAEDVINLERKIKWNSYVRKESARLTRGQVEEILCGNYDVLRDCREDLHDVFYYECRSKVMRPRVIVEYEREPYVMAAGQVRVTFDQHLRAGIDGWNLFDPNMATVELLDPGLLVMEVKYSEFLPEIVQKLLPTKSFMHTAVSKYVLACDKTLYKRQFAG